MKTVYDYRRLLALIFCLCVGVSGATAQDDLRTIAEHTMRMNPSPVIYEYNHGYRTAKLKRGKRQLYGCATDDPWVHPYVDAFKGAKAGWDVYLTVDTSAERPGAGEVDAHVGSYNSIEPYRGDKPGDLFVLGSVKCPFYAGKRAASDPDRDLVYIYGFERDASVIRLHGAPKDYAVVVAKDPETSIEGTALFYQAAGTVDLIAWIADWPPTDFDLTGPRFEFATAAAPKPELSGLDQLGDGGVHSFGVCAVDRVGNIYQTFLSSGPGFPDEKGQGSFHLVKWNREGKRLWIRRHGVVAGAQNGGELPYAIVANERWVFVCGHTKGAFGGPAPVPVDNIASHAMIAKFDAESGDLLQVRQLTEPGENGNAWSLVLDGAGEYLFVGGGDSDNGPRRLPHTSPFLTMLRQSDLSCVWREIIQDGRPFGSFRDVSTWQISNENIGGIAYDPDAKEGPTLYLSGYGAQGEFFGGKPGVTSVWSARYDLHGRRQWGKAFYAAEGEQYCFATIVDDSGDIYVVGQTQGSMDKAPYKGQGDGFIRKMSPEGKHIWTALVGGPDADEIQDICIRNTHVFVTGSTHGNLDGRNRGMADGFVAMLDARTGTLAKIHQFGTDMNDYPRSIVLGFEGELVISGTTEGSLVRPASGGWDVFVTTLEADDFMRGIQ